MAHRAPIRRTKEFELELVFFPDNNQVWSSYLGTSDGTGNGLSGERTGAVLSTASRAKGVGVRRLKALSMFSTCSSWPPLPRSAMNLAHNSAVQMAFQNTPGENIPGQLVVHNESTCAPKPWSSTIEHGHHVDGWLFWARLCALIGQVSLESKFCADSRPHKNPLGKAVNPSSPVCTHTQIDNIHPCDRSRNPCQSSVDYGTLKNPACTVGWVVHLSCSWLSLSKATQIQIGENPRWDNKVVI